MEISTNNKRKQGDVVAEANDEPTLVKKPREDNPVTAVTVATPSVAPVGRTAPVTQSPHGQDEGQQSGMTVANLARNYVRYCYGDYSPSVAAFDTLQLDRFKDKSHGVYAESVEREYLVVFGFL